MSTDSELNPVDNAVLENIKKYGKKIKKYELSYLIKRDIACSDLELTDSLRKLTETGVIKKTGNKEFLINY